MTEAPRHEKQAVVLVEKNYRAIAREHAAARTGAEDVGGLTPLGAITGATTVEDIPGNIFSTFCIGK